MGLIGWSGRKAYGGGNQFTLEFRCGLKDILGRREATSTFNRAV